MDEEQHQAGQRDKKRVNPSIFDTNMQIHFDELDKLLDKVGSNYGPILMEELQNRLSLIIKNFNEEINFLLKESFKKWKIIDDQLHEIVNIDIPLHKSSKKAKKHNNEDRPQFVKGIEFGPIKPK